jgi:biopolymer transport protein ExbD
MSKFKSVKSKKSLEISTASLPDIVFMILFFFMTVTVMKSDDIKVENQLPLATETHKLLLKDRIITIHVGKPMREFQNTFGQESVVQMNGDIVPMSELKMLVLEELSKMPDYVRPMAMVSLKVDKYATMGIVNDIKDVLKEINLLKINYGTYEGDSLHNLPDAD